MKKIYETPSVEKIKFNYRDQVVAASGGTNETQTTGDQWWSGCTSWEDIGKEVGKYLLEAISVCQYIPGLDG